MIGKNISHFKIIEELGAGGMGTVYLAQDQDLERNVAIKFLPQHLTSDIENVERFKREAKATATLNHPNIVTIYEIGKSHEQIFIVMEYIDGQSLRELITAKSRLTANTCIDIITQLCQGLVEAHQAGIVHRDIKPENILIDHKGCVKILDFGLAKLRGVSKLTKETSTLGTVNYMSPEQLRGDEADQRSDIWSLGIILYELLSGRLPFKGDYEPAIIYAILNEEAEPLSKHRDDIPKMLHDVVHKAISKTPVDRYQNAFDLLNDLKNFATSGIETPKSVQQLQKKKRFPVKTSLYLAALLILILVAYRVQGPLKNIIFNNAREKSIAVLPFATLTKSVEDESFSDGIHDDILTQLSKIGDLKVIARTSVIQYRNTKKRINEIAEELNVNSILEGTVRRYENRIRISAQLINAKTEDHLWAETYDREYKDIFNIQSDVAQKIAVALNAELKNEEKYQINSEPTNNLEAYNLYLKGNHYHNNYYSKDAYIKAAQLYEKAVALDSAFVLAYVKLVKVNTLLYVFKTWDHTAERLEKCKAALNAAIYLAPNSPEVRAAKGYYLEWIEKDYKQALREYEIALRNSPNNSTLLSSMGTLFLSQGDAEKATDYFIESYERDPQSKDHSHLVSWSYMLQRKWAEAEHWIDIYISQNPEKALAYYKKIEICIYGYGDLKRARSVYNEGTKYIEKFDKAYYPHLMELYARNFPEAYDILEADSTRPEVYLVFKGQVLDLMNEHERAIQTYNSAKSLLEDLIIKSPSNAFYHSWLGLAHAGLGNKTEALKYSNRARELHPINSDPWSSGEDILLEHAHISILVGDYNEALDYLEQLLMIPSQLTKNRLKLDPIYDPIRSHEKFKKLISP